MRLFDSQYYVADALFTHVLQLARKHNGRAQLVLLDHGLYRQIDDTFREQYAALWRSLIFADADGIKRHAEGMNAGDAYPLFAAMLTQRPWDQVGASPCL